MKKSFVIGIVLGVLALCIFGAGLWYQEEQVRKGDLIVLYPTEGVFAGGNMFVDKTGQTITSKTCISPITLWKDTEGQVFHQGCSICYRAYLVWDIPATEEKLQLYHQYFPS